jgi:enoyl-CoA hydratase
MDVELADGVTVVRMDHPPVNAMDLELADTAVAAIRDIDGPIVLTGAGRCFSAGVDLRGIVEGGAGDLPIRDGSVGGAGGAAG